MIAPISSFATPALSGIAARGFTAMRMGGGEYKPWDVKQEGGQMDSGWGTGEISCADILSHSAQLSQHLQIFKAPLIFHCVVDDFPVKCEWHQLPLMKRFPLIRML